MTRCREPVARIQVKPSASWAAEKDALVVVRCDLFDMAIQQVLVGAAVLAASIVPR